MTDHDPLCGYEEEGADAGDPNFWCDCALIAKVRADERERIARAIEAKHAPDAAGSGFCCFSDQIHRTLTAAARIARNGGSDE